MEYFIAFSIIFFVVVVIELTINIRKKDVTYVALDTNIPNPIDIVTSIKKCPRCEEEIKADAIKCKKCGSLINAF